VRTIESIAKMLKRVGLVGSALMVTGLVVRVWPALTHERVAGIPSVIDGDTLLVGGTRVRLDGIDAPEGRQICKKSHRSWSCGQAARVALERLVAGRPVTCRGHRRDRHNRLVAICEAGGREINREMVEAGFALSYNNYMQEEAKARGPARALGRRIRASARLAP
jgi:endonuclease YncB( thermonuclease family)